MSIILIVKMEIEILSTKKLISATLNINISQLIKVMPFKFSTEDSHTYSGFIRFQKELSEEEHLFVYMHEVAFLQLKVDMTLVRISGKQTSLNKEIIGEQSQVEPNKRKY